MVHDGLMVDSIKTPLDRQHLHVNDNNRHDTSERNNVPRALRMPYQPEAIGALVHLLYVSFLFFLYNDVMILEYFFIAGLVITVLHLEISLSH